MDLVANSSSLLGGTLKKTCEECTKSKVRCSGPESEGGICLRCASRGTQCVFRSKMKRGPQASDHSNSEKKQRKKRNNRKTKLNNEDEEDEDDDGEQDDHQVEDEEHHRPEHDNDNNLGGNLTIKEERDLASAVLASEAASFLYPPEISWHERRCWNVFFSTFKHQSTTENPTAWCWFALQIEKLRKDLERIQNLAAIARLEAFVASVHIKMSSLSQQTIQHCIFAPQLCGGCSSVALASSQVPSASSSKTTISSAASMTVGKCVQFLKPTKFPYIEFEMDNDGARIVLINELFTETFGHTKESLETTLAWSGGGGFLPWGGDLVSRLLWSEADVLVFLQVLAVKFQGLGPPIHDHENPSHVLNRELLSAYIFDVRVRNSCGVEDTVIPCMVKSVHRETLVGIELKITVMLEFEPISEPVKGPATPESSKEAMNLGLFRSYSASNNNNGGGDNLTTTKMVTSKSENSLSSTKKEVVLPTPHEDLSLLDPNWDWKTFESLFAEESSRPPRGSLSCGGDSSTMMNDIRSSSPYMQLETNEKGIICANISNFSAKASDEFWLGSLLDWTN